MDLIQKHIHMNRRKGRAVSQVHLEEDQNVPDSKPDVEKIIQEKSEVLVSEVHPAADHVTVRGALIYDLLYVDSEQEHQIHSMRGKAYFEENVHVEGMSDQDNVCVEWEYETPHVTIINSRKINVRTLLTLTVTIDEIYDEEVTVDVKESKGVEKQKTPVCLLQMRVSKKDILRVKNQWPLPSDKANVQEVLFYTITPKGVHMAVKDNEIRASGELLVFLLYLPEGDSQIPQWVEYSVRFDEAVECPGASEDMIGDIHWEPGSRELEMKPDADGEPRLISMECVLELSVKLYEEETVEMLTDLYGTEKTLTPVLHQVPFSKLLVRNESKCRTSQRMKVTDSQSRVLQICHSEGAVKTEHMEVVENGIRVDGVLWVQLFYITVDDAQPFRLARGSVAFSHVIDTPGISKTCSYHIYPVLEQLSANMVDSEEIEVKGVISMDTIVFEKQPEQVITAVEEAEPDWEALSELPGIVGYVIKEGEDLWTLAKRYYTTVEELMQMNELTEQTVLPGQQLVIIKSVRPAAM